MTGFRKDVAQLKQVVAELVLKCLRGTSLSLVRSIETLWPRLGDISATPVPHSYENCVSSSSSGPNLVRDRDIVAWETADTGDVV